MGDEDDMTIWGAIEKGEITREQMKSIIYQCLARYAGKKITATTVIVRLDSPGMVGFWDGLPMVADDILNMEYKPNQCVKE